ncbi:phosphatidate cytidylyltransferase [Arachnia propionica]|jgi:cytidylyltransferase family|uniref:Phosphatidate cytidylyltransferase n=1 Tax=Arachnia propionica TaxID=1750 RepID=A0A3N4D4P9_9ACTN|nr:phosphatidate cytidylyltransferase [Arachnia propionica]AFN47580.1 phosphatidate cytidylyltransferase [Arachnia propionica F0230a]QCT37461.1 phosphatidate cytidylyltransferase [Arachnia propionica]QUC10184.1 phosphatidate cytidylyltransferase [Arachnia propionica]QUC15134.1 phosphatidate cytidylyltransferase [Arachnia propionica]RPA17096.1 phosphatidate cytidylyltransferase [Arachnia propionica]
MPNQEPARATPTPKAGRDLPMAIGVGLVLLAALAVGLLWAPWFFVLISAVSLSLAVVEIHRALLRKGMHAQVKTIVAGTLVSVLGAYAMFRWNLGLPPTTFAVICVCGTVVACLVARLLLAREGFIRDIAASALIIAYIPLMGVFIPLMMAEPGGTRRIIAVVACVVASDTGAYAIGSLLGRHKMAPHISPSKTWEGFAGSIATSAVIGVAAALWCLGASWELGLVLGLCIAPAATLGDLVESLIKRDAGLKDMSNFLPGHGGFMDRLDSMLVAMPMGWLVLRLGMGG